jgi:hypothetical protein
MIVRGSVEKSRQRRSLPSPERLHVYALERFDAQAGRHFSVLTYSAYAPRVNMAAAFPSSGLRTGLDGPFGKTQGMLF